MMQYFISEKTYERYRNTMWEMQNSGIRFEVKPVFVPRKEPGRSERLRGLRVKREQLVGYYTEHEIAWLTRGEE